MSFEKNVVPVHISKIDVLVKEMQSVSLTDVHHHEYEQSSSKKEAVETAKNFQYQMINEGFVRYLLLDNGFVISLCLTILELDEKINDSYWQWNLSLSRRPLPEEPLEPCRVEDDVANFIASKFIEHNKEVSPKSIYKNVRHFVGTAKRNFVEKDSEPKRS